MDILDEWNDEEKVVDVLLEAKIVEFYERCLEWDGMELGNDLIDYWPEVWRSM